MEAARYEAEKVVTQLRKDHEAWGYVPKEAKRRWKQTEAEPESRGRETKKTEPLVAANQQVHFEGESKGERKTVSADVHKDG